MFQWNGSLRFLLWSLSCYTTTGFVCVTHSLSFFFFFLLLSLLKCCRLLRFDCLFKHYSYIFLCNLVHRFRSQYFYDGVFFYIEFEFLCIFRLLSLSFNDIVFQTVVVSEGVVFVLILSLYF